MFNKYPLLAKLAAVDNSKYYKPNTSWYIQLPGTLSADTKKSINDLYDSTAKSINAESLAGWADATEEHKKDIFNDKVYHDTFTKVQDILTSAGHKPTPTKVDDLATRHAKFLQSKKPFLSESALAIGLLAAIGTTGAYYLDKKLKQQEKQKQQQAEAAAAIMAAKKLSEEQRRRLLRNLGIGTGAALGGYGLYSGLK